jgi:GntR family transcriptional regulator / MocR family aminotransferase
MHTRGAWTPLLSVERASDQPLHRQLYGELRRAIITGRFRRGMRLPATRVLAADLGVSRNTVISAFDQLRAEGYLESRVGSGAFVSNALPDDLLSIASTHEAKKLPASIRPALSKRGRAIGTLGPFFPPVQPRPFRHGLPALDAFPLRQWARIAARRWRRLPRELLGYGDAAGYQPLRQAIADYLAEARAVRCEAGQIVMAAGSQQALYVVAQLLLDPGDQAWIEDPGYLGARTALLAAQATLAPVPTDEHGLHVAHGASRWPRAKLAYVTPSNQYPTTVTMSLARRMELLEWARRAGAWIVEDDYDSEFRFTSRPVPSLQGLDSNGLVIYIGTFSKMLVPGLRLGYIVLPPALVDMFAAASALMTRHLPSIEQVVLTDFITEGHLARHVRRMRTLYSERRRQLLALQDDLAPWLEIQPPEAGIHALAWLRRDITDTSAARAALDHGVETRPFSVYCLGATQRHGLLLGYGGFRDSQLRAGARKLAAALASCARHP